MAAGRLPIDPAVLFKMLMVGFLEGIGSGRGIAARCADSLIIRRFLGYALTEETPDHSSLSVFRQRLPEEVFAAAHEVVLEGLRAHGLLKGRHLGIDSSVMEANASLSGLVRRNDEKSIGTMSGSWPGRRAWTCRIRPQWPVLTATTRAARPPTRNG